MLMSIELGKKTPTNSILFFSEVFSTTSGLVCSKTIMIMDEFELVNLCCFESL